MSLEEIKKILRGWASRNDAISKLYIYGSRVKGDFKKISDLDIAIEIDPRNGDTNELTTWICEGSNWEEELKSLIPKYKIHLEWCNEDETPTVKTGVDDSGVLIYSRDEEAKGKE
jgi:predicted nucleotidyltransferase